MTGPGIALTGLGAVSALGPDVAGLLQGLCAARHRFRPLTRFDPGDVPARPVGEVAVLPGRAEDGSPTHRLATAAAREAWADASPDVSPERIAVVMGTTTGGIAESERWYLKHLDGQSPDPARLGDHVASTVTGTTAAAIGATGPRLTLSTACSSGANALSMGADLLRAGLCDVVLAGGADALSRITYLGFSSLRLLSDAPCRPFDAERDGLTLGEAGACVVLERLDEARARGARIHAHLLGSATTCDAYHMTQPAPGGEAVIRAMTQALAAAGLSPEDIDYINAHATSTPANDTAEALALRAVFGDTLPPVSATKSLTGHTLGAAGALEAVITALALREGLLPPTASTRTPEPGAPDDLVLGTSREAPLRAALSTSFAFGGNNAALIFGRATP